MATPTRQLSTQLDPQLRMQGDHPLMAALAAYAQAVVGDVPGVHARYLGTS